MSLNGKHVVVLAEDTYEDQELWYPYFRLKEEGADVRVAGMPDTCTCRSKHGYEVSIDVPVTEVDAAEVDALVIPGGYAPDLMRTHEEMVDLVRRVNSSGGIIAFICHAGWVPISAGILNGRRATSYAAIKDDMMNAGAEWIDESVVRDGNLISSRMPDDLPDFCRTLIEALSK
jgi:protease I